MTIAKQTTQAAMSSQIGDSHSYQVRLVSDTHRKHTVLLNQLLWEARVLPAGAWTLVPSPDAPYQVRLFQAGVEVDVGTYLQKRLRRQDGEFHVVGGQACTDLLSYQRSHTCHYERMTFSLPHKGSGAFKDLHCRLVIYQVAKHGARLHFDVHRFQAFAFPEDSKFYQSRIYLQNRHAMFTRVLAQVGLETCHILRPTETRLSKSTCDYGALECWTWSAYATLALLSHLSVKANPNIRSMVEALLQGLITKYFGAEVVELEIVVDLAAQQVPSFDSSGKNPVVLQMTDGVVDLAPLLSHPATPCALQRSLRQCANEVGAVSLCKLLQHLSLRMALARHAPSTAWLMKQLVCSLGCLVEDVVLELPPSTAASSDEHVRRKGQRRDQNHVVRVVLGLEGRAKSEISPVLFPAAALVLAKYMKASKQAFSSSRTLGIAVDAARIGQREALCGMIMNDSGTCSWMAPQAVSSEYQSPRLLGGLASRCEIWRVFPPQILSKSSEKCSKNSADFCQNFHMSVLDKSYLWAVQRKNGPIFQRKILRKNGRLL